MIQIAKTTSWGEIEHDRKLWVEHLKDPIVALNKALK